MALGFVIYIPVSKAMHMVVDAANLAVHDPASARHLPKPAADSDHVGYRTLGDFTWKELVDLDACTKCGRCHVACPAQVAGGPLSPRDLVLDLRQWVDQQSGLHTVLDWEDRPSPTGPLSGNGDTKLAGDVIKEQTLWACTTCMACVEACPVGIEHVSTIVQLRRSLVDEGRMEPSLQDALQNLATQGNSFGKSARQRARWTKGLDFKIKDARKEPVRYLWFVGDYASFDERVGGLSRSLATILNGAGVDFGILYEDERNSGNDVRRVGEEGLFEMLVEQNIAAFAKAEFDEIVTTDPHSLNTLRNEYPEFGLDKPVRHYTELLADLVEDGTIPVKPWADGHLPRPLLPGPLQRGDRRSPEVAEWPRVHDRGDAPQPRQHLLLRRRRRPDLDGRLQPHRAPEREPHQGSGDGRRRHLRRGLPQGHDDVHRRRQDHRQRGDHGRPRRGPAPRRRHRPRRPRRPPPRPRPKRQPPAPPPAAEADRRDPERRSRRRPRPRPPPPRALSSRGRRSGGARAGRWPPGWPTIAAAAARYDAFAFSERPGRPRPPKNRATRRSVRDLALAALRAAGDPVAYAMLRRMAGGDTALTDLGADTGLPRLAVWERVNGLVAVGLAGRRQEDDTAGLTPAGQTLVELVEGAVAAATSAGHVTDR